MEALDLSPSFPKKILAVYKPDPAAHEVYMKKFEKFGRIYQLVKDEFNG
jgi:hypothetical protein